jgi:hypothetical protein
MRLKTIMINRHSKFWRTGSAVLALTMLLAGLVVAACVISVAQKDPAEPLQGRPNSKLLPRPAHPISRQAVDERSMRALIEQLVACGTRNSLSSWSDPQHGVGCGRDRLVARLDEISKQSSGRLRVVVDKFEATSARTSNIPASFENVYAILPGSDPQLSKTVFIVSGHFDSRASDPMDPSVDAPGADDDASGVAVSMECARLLSRDGANEDGSSRATLLFAAVSGEEQGLLGGTRLLEWTRQHGYTVGGMLDDDIVGSDPVSGAPHRVRLFSGGGHRDDPDPSSREMARAIEEIDGRQAIRLVFRIDRLGRGGDHYPFYQAGLPAVRFTEPLEDYHHQHQTPRTESGIEYGDFVKYLNFTFLGNVARANAEALRELSLAPAPPREVNLTGGVTPDAKIGWSADDDADRAGFEILWRESTEPRWMVYDFVKRVGDATLLGVSTDNHFFGLRSVGKNGARSIAVSVGEDQRTPPASGTPRR